MEDGRDLSTENVEQEPEDDSFNLSDVDDINHSSDNEQDKDQKLAADLDGHSGRSTAEPPTSITTTRSTTSEALTLLSDEESGSIALDDSLAEEDAALKNNLELMSGDEDGSVPHNTSQDLQLSSDSSSSSSDLNSTTKSENDDHPSSQNSSDVISRINSCLNSMTASSRDDKCAESESLRTNSAESVDCVAISKDYGETDALHLRISSDSDQEVVVTEKACEQLNPEEPNRESEALSTFSLEEVNRVCKPAQEDTVPPLLDSQHSEAKVSVSELLGETSQSTVESENRMVCDSELIADKELNDLPLSDPVQDNLPVLEQPNPTEDSSKSACVDVSNSISVITGSNSIDIDSNQRFQGEQCMDVAEGDKTSGDLISDELNVAVDLKVQVPVAETLSNVLDSVQEKSDLGLTDVCSDVGLTDICTDADSSEEENTADNSAPGSFSKLNGGLSESMEFDDTNLSETFQGAPSLNSSDQCTKPVVTSNALNAAWKKAFANTAKKYEAPAPEEMDTSCKSPGLLETSNTGSSETSSNESSAQEEEEEEEEEGDEVEEDEDDYGGDAVLPGGADECSERICEVTRESLSSCPESPAFTESLNLVSEGMDPARQATPEISEQAQRLQSSKVQLPQPSNADKNALISHPSVSGPGKTLFESSQSLAGMHVNMANPIPEYPQYLGVQPTVKFKCVRCGIKGFTSMMELKTHQLSCLKNSSPAPQAHQVPTSPSASTNFRITRKVYLCSACGTYYENWNLFLHMREVHKRHICLFCLGMFSQAEKLSLHLISKHKVTEGHYSSPEDFKCSYKGLCFLMCCTCEKMFTEDNFTNHLCRGDFVVCAVCGGEGIHLPSCQLSSTSRNQVINQPKRLQLTSVPEAIQSNQALTQQGQHQIQEALEGRRNTQVNSRSSKLGRKVKPKQILKVRIPIKPPVGDDNSVNVSQALSKRISAPLPSSEAYVTYQDSAPNVEVASAAPNSSSNLDKTINSVALGLTDEARAWEQRMESERKRIEEARQIYTDSDDESVGADEEAELLRSSSSDEEIAEVNKENNGLVPCEENFVTDESFATEERESTIQHSTHENHDIAENEGQSQPMDASHEHPLLSEEPGTLSAELKESRDTDDSDSEKLSLVVDDNQVPSLDELNPVHELPSEEVPSSVDVPNDDGTAVSEANQEDRVENSDLENLVTEERQSEEVPMEEESILEESFTEAPESPVETPHTDALPECDTNGGAPVSGAEQSGGEDVSDCPPQVPIEIPENRLVEGYTLAGSDVPETELALDKPLHIMKTQEVLKECVRTLCWTCVYCSHAKKIAVNGKQLALHVLSEHRITPVDGTQNEMPAGDRFIAKLKEALDPLHSMHFNTDSYDSTNVANFLPYDRSYECFHCHFYTRLHKELYIHNRKMHQKTILLCIMCKSNFYSYSELLCHLCPGIYIPQCNVSFRCCMCNVDKLPSAFRLMVHLRKRHHACDVCLEITDDQQKLSNHVWKHKLHHLCYRCGIAYRNKPDITKHLFWKHGTESVLCKKCLQKKWPHVYHFCIPPATFVCEECSATFSRAVSLRVHKRLHSEDFRYPCAECEEKFISKKLLARHKVKHETPVPPVIDIIPEERERNVTPELEIRVSPTPKSAEEEKQKPPEGNVESGKTSPSEKKHSKKKKHKRDEQEEEKQKKSVDVFDLPPLNLSSDSDSSDDEGKSQPTQSASLEPAPEHQPTQSPPSVADEGKMEVEEPAPIIDGIWDKFQDFQASLEKRDAMDDPEQFMRRTIMMDHDYCLPPGKPPGTVAASTLSGDSEPAGSAAPPEVAETPGNLDASETPKSSPTKKKKTPKKRERDNSGRVSSSSSSDSSSDSDSSSCSCGSNCSCSSSSSSSSGSSSSSSDSDDSSSSEGRRKSVSKKDRNKEKSEKEKDEGVNGNEPEQTIAQPVIEEPHIDVLEAEPTVRESDLDTTETDTDEDFYDDNPQKLANELLQEKRNLMLLAAVAPINNGSLSPTQSPSSQPSIAVPHEPTPVKRKGKKRRKRQTTNSRQAKTNQVQSMASQGNLLPSEQQYPSYIEQPGLQEVNISASVQQFAASSYYAPQTPAFSNSQVVPHSQASQSATPKARKATFPKIHDYSAQSVGSGSETEGRTKRKRMRNRFYGFGSDGDEDSSQQSNNKVKKSNASYQTLQEPTPPLIMPPLTIKRSQVQPPLDPVYQSPVPSATWSTNLLPSVKSDSDNDSDVRQANASSSSDTDSDDDAMQIAESPPPPPPPQYEAPRTGENKDNLYCYCQCPYDEVSEMIACDGVDCRIEWFHFECVGIMVPPKGQWYCPDCRRRMSGGQDYMLN